MFYGNEMNQIAVWNSIEAAAKFAPYLKTWQDVRYVNSTKYGGWVIALWDGDNFTYVTKGLVLAVLSNDPTPRLDDPFEKIPFLDPAPRNDMSYLNGEA